MDKSENHPRRDSSDAMFPLPGHRVCVPLIKISFLSRATIYIYIELVDLRSPPNISMFEMYPCGNIQVSLSFLRIFSPSSLYYSYKKGRKNEWPRKKERRCVSKSESRGLIIGLAVEKNVWAARRRELRFPGVWRYREREMDERAKERIFPRKKLPKITLFRLRLVLSPLNPVSRGETRLVRRPSFTDRHHRFRTEATRNGVDGTKR